MFIILKTLVKGGEEKENINFILNKMDQSNIHVKYQRTRSYELDQALDQEKLTKKIDKGNINNSFASHY